VESPELGAGSKMPPEVLAVLVAPAVLAVLVVPAVLVALVVPAVLVALVVPAVLAVLVALVVSRLGLPEPPSSAFPQLTLPSKPRPPKHTAPRRTPSPFPSLAHVPRNIGRSLAQDLGRAVISVDMDVSWLIRLMTEEV